METLLEFYLGDSWLMYHPSLVALHTFYKDVMALKASVGHLKREDIEQLFHQHEEAGLSSLMHRTPTSELSAMRERGIPIEGTRYARMRNSNIAVLDLIGPIFPRANMMTMSSGVSMEQWAMDFQRLFNSPDVKAMMIHADTPGGDARGISAAARMVHQAAMKGTKNIYTFVSGHLASGGMYVAAPTHKIIVDEWSSVGSIGVKVGVPTDDGADVREFVSDGDDLKAASPDTDAGKEYYQTRANDMVALFRRDMVKYRANEHLKTVEDVKALRGAVFLGKTAISKGLADKVGTYEGTLHSLITARPAGAASTSASEGREVIYVINEATEEVRAIDLASDNGEDEMGLSKKFRDKIATIMSSKGQLAGEGAAQDNETDDVEEGTEAGDGEGTGKPKVLTAAEIQARRGELTATFEDDVITFAENVVMESKCMPAEAMDVAQDMMDAKLDDAIYGGTVSFLNAENKEVTGTREAKVRAKYERKPKHSMAARHVAALKRGDVKGHVLKPSAKAETDTGEDDDEATDISEVSDERKDELLAKSSQGRMVLAQRKRDNNHRSASN